ncbi:MAG TPA: polysaccharide deacetylase [Clostridia bacterium]|nr:polysaccharide deacetylase [Clostridia bacterium]
MKPKWIICFSLLFTLILLVCMQPPWTHKNFKELNSTAQAHTGGKQVTENFTESPTSTNQEAITKIENHSENSKPEPNNTTPSSNDKPKESNEKSQEIEENQEQTNDVANDIIEDEQTPVKAKKVFLTFDDGPSSTTEILLNILQDFDAKATFFMLEPQMTLYPDSIKRMAQEEHGLGLHGVTHNRNLFYQSPESALAEMQLAQSTLAALTGVNTFLVRTPYGSKPHMTEMHKIVMSEAGFIIWDWNVDSKDWFFKDRRLIEYTIGQIERLADKGIQPVILFHDNKHTIKYLPEVLTYLLENDYEFEILDSTMEAITFH